jgi:hypothetical protein
MYFLKKTMKKFTLTNKVALLLALLLPINANANFSNDYAVVNWTQTLIGNDIISTLGNPNSISLTSDNSSTGGGDTLFSITTTTNGKLSFNWDYSTSDSFGPRNDFFGYILNNVFTQLSNDAGANLQSGSIVLDVLMGDYFAFDANSLDGTGGAATTTISNFNFVVSNVPEPEILYMLVIGFAGWRIKRKTSLPNR